MKIKKNLVGSGMGASENLLIFAGGLQQAGKIQFLQKFHTRPPPIINNRSLMMQENMQSTTTICQIKHAQSFHTTQDLFEFA